MTLCVYNFTALDNTCECLEWEPDLRQQKIHLHKNIFCSVEMNKLRLVSWNGDNNSFLVFFLTKTKKSKIYFVNIETVVILVPPAMNFKFSDLIYRHSFIIAITMTDSGN